MPSSGRTLRALDWLNFLLADVQTGVGPFLAIYLAATTGMSSASELRSRSAESPASWHKPLRGRWWTACTLPTLLALLSIRPDEIDYQRARGATSGAGRGQPARASALLADRPLVMFLVCAVLFHFANAAMLPLLGEMLARGQGRSSMMFMSACVITTQLTITAIASWSGRKAGTWGRKPLLLIAFGVLPVRAVLYTLTGNTFALVAIQLLDGIGAGIFGVVSVLVIADLAQGSGRFNLTLGAITTAVGIGAALSQAIAGTIVHHFNFDVGFLFLAAVAAAALAILYFLMPETRDQKFLGKKA